MIQFILKTVVVQSVPKVIDWAFSKNDKVEDMLSGKKTYIGVAMAIIPVIAGFFGYEATHTFNDSFSVVVNDIISIVGAAMAAYGRAVASVPGMFAKKK